MAISFASFLGGFFGAGVVIALIPRQIAVRDVEASRELTSAMTELANGLTRDKMRAVRAATKEANATAILQASSPNPAINPPQKMTKEELRKFIRDRSATQ